MQCVVLAGGFGRRMRPATDTLPKCLLAVFDRPFVDWQLEWLAAEGVDEVVFSIGYRGDLIRRHVGDGRRYGLRVVYVDEGDCPLGTAGALRLSLDEGVLEPTFSVLYGDSYLPIHLRAVQGKHDRSPAPVLMTVYRDTDRLERPNAVFVDGMVTWYEKGLTDPPPDMRYVDYGLSVWKRDVVEARVPAGAQADLSSLFTDLSLAGELAGYEATERFYEIGSPEGLRALDRHLRTVAGQGRRTGSTPDLGGPGHG
ncbi:MAG: sugar phosphate nucleotidyltransferase [Acidimicrobiales bacterium]